MFKIGKFFSSFFAKVTVTTWEYFWLSANIVLKNYQVVTVTFKGDTWSSFYDFVDNDALGVRTFTILYAKLGQF